MRVFFSSVASVLFAGAVLLPCAAFSESSLYEKIKNAGITPATCISGGSAGVEYHGDYGPGKAFDGITESNNDTERYLGKISKGAHLHVKVPNVVASSVKPVKYRVWRLSTSWSVIGRAPIAWNFYGITPDGKTNLISTVTLDDSNAWDAGKGVDNDGNGTGTGEFREFSDFDFTKGDQFTGFVWKPTASNFTKEGKYDDWDVGLMELEIFIEDIDDSKVKIEAGVIPGTGKVTVTGKTEDDIYDKGTELTFTAEGENGYEFYKWAGTVVPAGSESNPTITIKAEKSGRIMPVFKGMWILDTVNKRLSDTYDNWILKVGTLDLVNNTFWMGDSSGWQKNLYVRGEGVMDLSTPICSTDGYEWKTVNVRDAAFGIEASDEYFNATPNGRITTFIAPKTWLGLSQQAFNTAGDSVTNITLDCPLLAGELQSWSMTGIGQVKKLVMKLPKVTKIYGCTLPGMKLDETDVTEWDLSSLTEIERTWNSDGSWQTWCYGFSTKNFTGTMTLPKIKKIDINAFRDTPNFSGAILGTDGGTVESIAAGAFGGTCGIKRLVVAGSSKGWTVEENAITLDNNLTEIVILSVPPNNGEKVAIFGQPKDKAKTICFYVPDSKEWADVFAVAQPIESDEDKQAVAAYLAANTGAEEPVGIIPAAVFGTANPQFIGKAKLTDYNLGTKISYSVKNGAYGDTISGPDQSILHNPGSVVEFTANIASGSNFAGWEGLPEGIPNTPTVFILIGLQPIELTLKTVPTWFFYPAYTFNDIEYKNVITDGRWILNAYVKDREKSQLAIGKNGSATLAGWTGVGRGVLDLSGPVRDADGNTWHLTHFDDYCFSTPSGSSIWYLDELVFPTNVVQFGNQMVNCNAQENISTLTSVIIDAPDCESNLSNFMFNHNMISYALIRAPKIKHIGNGFLNYGNSLERSDFSEWDLESVASVGDYAFTWKNAKGTFTLPSLTSVGEEGIRGNTQFTNLVIGTKYKITDNKELSVKSISFAENTSLKSITFGPYVKYNTEVDNVFKGDSALKSVYFSGRPPQTKFLDDLVQSAKAVSETDSPLVIYASANLNWDKEPVAKSATEEEKAKAPPLVGKQYVIGVYKAGDVSKALIVHNPSEFDPKGTIVIIR